jgi:hypothetical protein
LTIPNIHSRFAALVVTCIYFKDPEEFLNYTVKQTQNVQTVCIILIGLYLSGCSPTQPVVDDQTADQSAKPEMVFSSFEDLNSPRFLALKEKYQLDTIVDHEKDDFKRILLLRHWIREVVPISDFEESYPDGGYCEKILDAALEGHGFHCGHYMIVQNAVMNAYGYVTRCLGAGPGVKGGPDGHHGINEIWSNQFQKWFLSDAKYNHHFEKNGIPLSALEVRDEYLKNKAADISLVKGRDRQVIPQDGVENAKGEIIQTTKERFAQTYTWIEWESVNNRFTGWPDNSDAISKLIMYADAYFKNNTWIWDGKPHWAYSTEYMLPVSDRRSIEWIPNSIEPVVKIEADVARITLTSVTPNLKSYQMKEGNQWKDVPASLDLPANSGTQEYIFRTINLADVPGPEYKLSLTRAPKQ